MGNKFDWFETKEKYYLAFEMAEGGELFERLADAGRFTERDAADIVFQLLHGISFIHAHDIVHRDLKPENMYIQIPLVFLLPTYMYLLVNYGFY